jgi:hypothetical protein
MSSTETKHREGDFRDIADIIRQYSNEQLENARKAADGEILALEPPQFANLLLPGDIVGKPVLSNTGRIAAVVECKGLPEFQAVVATGRLGCHFRTLKSGVTSIKFLRFADCVKNTDPAFTYDIDGKTHFVWGDWEMNEIAFPENKDEVVDVLVDVGAAYYKQAVFLVHHAASDPEYNIIHFNQGSIKSQTNKFEAGYRPRAFSCNQQKDKSHPQLIGLFDETPCWLITNNYDGSKSDGRLCWGKDRNSSHISNLRKDSLWFDGQRLTFVAYHLAKCRTCIFTLDRQGLETVQEIGPRDLLVAHSQGNYFWPGDMEWPVKTTRLHSSSDAWCQNGIDLVWVNQLVGDGQGGVYAYKYMGDDSLSNPCIIQHYNEAGEISTDSGPCRFNARWIQQVGNTLMAAHNNGVVRLKGQEYIDPVLPPQNVRLNEMVEVVYEHEQMVLAVKSEGPRTVSLLRFA